MRPGFSERLREAIKASGLSQRKIEAKAGLHTGHVSNLLNRVSEKVTADTTQKLAAALGVDFTWLSTGHGEMHGAPASSSSPTLGKSRIAALLDEVFDGARHKPSDTDVVRAMLESGIHPGPGSSLEELVGAWLDAAARVRLRGAVATPEAVVADLTARVIDLERRRPPSNPSHAKSA